MSNPKILDSVHRTRSSVSHESESSPLNKVISSTSRTRRRSTAEKLALGVKRAMEAFEFEVVEQSDSDDLEDSPSVFEDEHVEKVYRKTGWRYIPSILCIGLFFGLSFALGALTSSLTSVQSTAHEDPIMSLKANSFIGNLQNGAVASDQAICSEVGNEILQLGGNVHPLVLL